MSYHKVFSKSYDDELGFYRYECNGIVSYSNLDLSEEEVRSNLEVLY